MKEINKVERITSLDLKSYSYINQGCMVLAEILTHRSMKQNSELKSRPTQIRPVDF